MSLQQLPTELVLAVAEYLGTKELASLVRSARRYHYILTTTLYESAVTLTPASDDDPQKTYYFPRRGGRKIVDFGWTTSDRPVDWKSEPVLDYFKSKDRSLFTAWDSNGATGFHHLAAKGAFAVLDILRQEGADIDAVMAGQYTPLAWMFHKMVAANWDNYVPLIQWFLEQGTNVLVQNERGRTLLVEAAKTAPAYVVSSIIEKIKAANGNIWTADATGKGPFWHALANGNPGAVTELLKCGADVLEKYDNGWNALHIAAKSGDPRVCGTIISAMGPANRAIFEVNGDTNTALHIALRSGHDKAGVLLLNTGFDPRKPDFRGNTPLDLILQAELTETFELLLRLTKDQWPLQRLRWPQLVYAASRGTGASVRMILRAMAFGVVEPFIRPKQPFFGLTPLHCFSKRWREATDPLEMLSHLFALGEDVNTVDRAGNTPLHLLLLSREEDDDPEQYLQVVHEMLVHYKCPIHHQNVNGNTILHFAACHNDIRLLEMVVKRIDKPTILAVNKQGLTALHCAVNPRIETTGRTDVFEGIMEVSRRYPTKPVIHLLVSKGIYVDAKTNAGFTALHMACADNKKIQAVEALLEAGADAGMKDYEGNPPLHWANVRGCDKAILTLLSHRSELHENCYTCDPRLWGLQDPTSSKDTAKRMEVVYGVEWMPIANEADLWDDGGPGNAAS